MRTGRIALCTIGNPQFSQYGKYACVVNGLYILFVISVKEREIVFDIVNESIHDYKENMKKFAYGCIRVYKCKANYNADKRMLFMRTCFPL